MKKRLQWLFFAACVLASVAADGQEPREPGFNELVVIDPAVQENGLPIPIVEGGQVEIPPTLHVHPYYYCGDKEYQAQILNGGPTIIVANHPKTGDKLYIDAVLPAGAPEIAYNANSITYVYSDRRVVIEFPPLCRHKAVVRYVSGRGVGREVQDQVAEVSASIQEHKQKSRLVTELGELKSDCTNITKGTAGIAGRTAAIVVERTRAVTRILPGVAALKSAGQQAEERGALEEVRQAGIEQLRNETKTFRTNR
jgi:hypothetical protein